MIRLKNIKYQNNRITADMHLDDATIPGSVIANKEGIIEFSLPEKYDYAKYSMDKIENFIVENFEDIKAGDIGEKVLMWY